MSKKTDSPLTERVKRNIESIAQLEQAFERQRTLADRVSDAVSAFGGSVRFICANAAVILGWVAWNLLAPHDLRFDPALAVLELLIGVEALFLSAFVLMSQNRQNRQTDHWAHVDLQISLLGEQETTKLLQMMQNLCHALGLDKTARDQELKQLAEPLTVETLAEEVGKARQPEEAGRAEIEAVLVEETLAEKKAASPPAAPKPPEGRAEPPPS